ncbi:hypothetical protein [Sorangium sp. So ce388]|uniref:hypothetical protein n=1 Tax=Sorangium sp. So ce388 TaxID=3133309 RepID=UPI003F5C4C7A
MAMTRPTQEKGRQVVNATLTLRLTRHDRELLQALVALQAEEMSDTGVEVTAASYVRGLIRHEARKKGLLEPAAASPPRRRPARPNEP